MEPPLSRIRRLPPVLANQIAAGEVVERPAAVVKELLENSVDSGAQHVRIDVEEGGVALIRVRDDGCGISADQLTLALARHATSKLHDEDALQNILTLGFRGEALPSIASVARVRISSKVAGADRGYEVRLEGAAEPADPIPTAHPNGTTVEVRDLFFNTPARRRFLRATRTEYLHIEKVVRRLAIARPGLGVELWHTGKRTVRALADNGQSQAWLASLTDSAFARDAIPMSDAADEMRLHGWVLAAPHARAHDDIQHICVNGRVVRDPMLRHAIRVAFEQLLDAGRQAAYVLYLELPPQAVDVNVHPTKHELRFREPRAVHDFLVSAISRGIGQPAVLDLGLAPEVDANSASFDSASATSISHPLAGSLSYRANNLQKSDLQKLGGTQVADAAITAPGRWLLELEPGFILTTTGTRHLMVSLSALARCSVETILEQALTDSTTPVSQPLLLPYVWRLSKVAADRLEPLQSTLQAVGIESRRSAPEEFMLLAVPRVLDGITHALIATRLEAWVLKPGRDMAADLVQALALAAADGADHAGRKSVDRWLACCEESAAGVWVTLDRQHFTNWSRGE